MKNKIILAVAVLGVILIAATQLDNEPKKFGHLDMQAMLFAMPEMDTVQTKLEEYGKELNAEFEDAYIKHQELLAEYDTLVNTAGVTPSKVERKQKELADSEKNLYELQQILQQDLEEKKAILLQPLIERIQKAIKEVSTEKGLNYVFDTSIGALVYTDEMDDITAAVKEKL